MAWLPFQKYNLTTVTVVTVTNKINVIFLIETDTLAVKTDNDYQISGFKTIVQNKKSKTEMIRIICLVKNELAEDVIIRMDKTSNNFPSLWMEVENN